MECRASETFEAAFRLTKSKQSDPLVMSTLERGPGGQEVQSDRLMMSSLEGSPACRIPHLCKLLHSLPWDAHGTGKGIWVSRGVGQVKQKLSYISG